MPTSIENKIRMRVKETLDTYGATGTLYSRAVASEDVSAGTQSAAVTPIPVKVSPPKAITQYVGGELVETGESRVVLAALDLSVAPEVDDQIDPGTGDTYTITRVEEIKSGDLAAAYKLRIRR